MDMSVRDGVRTFSANAYIKLLGRENLHRTCALTACPAGQY
jgi:hypothetical protein